LFIVLAPLVLIDALYHAAAKGLWFDEILTVLVPSQDKVSSMWDILFRGMTSHPPTFYLIEHVMDKLGGNENITLRLPSIAAFLCVMVCMFVFLRRRAGGLIAVVSTAALLVTSLYDFYAFEARPYDLMVACIAIALLCYERAGSIRWALLLGLALAAASALNFYAVLAFFPFGLAELTHLVTERKFRPQVWLAFLAGGLPYFAFWPILRTQRLLFGAHFWAAPTLWRFANTFGELLYLGTPFSCAMFGAAFIYLAYLALSGNVGRRPTSASGLGFTLSDVALTLGFLAIPLVTLVAAKIGHGAFALRYVIATALGISLALGLILSRLKRSAVVSVGLFVLCVFVFQEASFWSLARRPQGAPDPIQVPSQMATDLNLPLVISNGLVFVPVWYHANDDLKSRLFFLADPQEQYAASGNDTTTIQMLTLKDWPKMNIEGFPDFARNHRKFLIYSDGDAQDFWPRLLIQRGYSLRTVAVDAATLSVTDGAPTPPKAIVYLVDLDERK
jgi:4-amino-4-deoxy-L-arabinose transferase-like glycosyltransferase